MENILKNNKTIFDYYNLFLLSNHKIFKAKPHSKPQSKLHCSIIWAELYYQTPQSLKKYSH